jgi:tetratricopeptide (TPR) repeat protein
MDPPENLSAALAGRYRLDGEIGRGGMAVVYHARDLQHGRDVAVKVVRPELAVGIGTERFLREIHIAASLQHPHILPVFDSGSANGLLYYVMPYVSGESLRDRLQREGQLPLIEALRIAHEVADALAYAHGRGVVHRDIKPANILLSGYPPDSSGDGWHAIVADFGVARALLAAGSDQLTGTGCVVGTPEYMSPEQAGGEATLDGRSDIYSLGCVLYEMLAGEPPFTGRTPQVVVARHCHEAPRSVRVIRPSLPPDIEGVMETALAKVPADRFPTARAFGDRVDPAVWRESLPTAKPARRRQGAGIALAACAIALWAAAFVAQLGREASAPAAPGVGIMILPFERLGEGSGSAAGTPPHLIFNEAFNWIPGLRGVSPRSSGGTPAGSLEGQLQEAKRAGAKYLVKGVVLPRSTGQEVAIDLYSTGTAERITHVADTTAGPSPEGTIDRLALRAFAALAPGEGFDLPGQRAAIASTSSIEAVGHLLRGQARLWREDYAAAADELRAAVEADSGCGLAYQRLGVVYTWSHDYPAALGVLEAGLSRRDQLDRRWVGLLEGQRYHVLGMGDSAIAAFQGAVLDRRDDIDGWLGLGESLVHFAAFTGHSVLDARSAFERVAALDSSFAPIYEHLIDLAVYAGDERAARAYLARLLPDNAAKVGKSAEVALRFGTSGDVEVLATLRSADREILRETIISWAHGGFDLKLADSAAGYLMAVDRTPDDRRRGAQYRLVLRAGQGRLADARQAWSTAAAAYPFDPWMVQTYLAGYPVGDLVKPMFAWAHARVMEEGSPAFGRPPWDEGRQAFEALVYRALLEGDSSETLDLLRRIRRAPPPNPTDPSPVALGKSLEARLQLLAGDTAAAVTSLRQSLSQIPEIYTANHPLVAMAPQRLLLSELAASRGDSVEAGRWRDSFSNSWSVADVLYLSRLGQVRTAP